MRRRLAMLVFGAALASTAPALADGTDAAKAFDEGRKLRDQMDFDKAANAFERSVAAEPSIGAYYNLAFSYEQLGRTREALDAYRKALKIAKEKGDPRDKEASDAVAKLLETHNYVTVLVSDEIDKAAGVRIVVDGEVVPQKQLKGEVFRSGTQHDVVVSAPGRKDRRVTAANKQSVMLTLGDGYEAATAAPPPPPPAESHDVGWGWQKWTGAGLGVAGVGAVVVGAVFTADYFSTKSDILDRFDKLCNAGGPPCKSETPTRTTMAFDKLTKEAEANEDRAPLRQAVAYGLGGLLLVGGIYLFVTAPSGSEPAPSPPNALRLRVIPQVGLRDNGLSFVGTF